VKFQNARISFHLKPSCSMRTDRRKDTSKLIVFFRNFTKTPSSRHYWINVESNLKHQDTLDFNSNCYRSLIYHKVGARSVAIRHRCASTGLEGTVSYPAFRATLFWFFKVPLGIPLALQYKPLWQRDSRLLKKR
jgi:hypothetical protein